MADRHLGRPWVIEGAVWFHGSRARSVTKTVTIGSESELEAAEKELRDLLVTQVEKLYKPDELRFVKVEVKSEVEKSVGQ